MPVNVQIRDVPDDLHRRLREKAARLGMSLNQYLLREVRRLAEFPTMEELRERFERLPRIEGGEHPEDILRQERDAR